MSERSLLPSEGDDITVMDKTYDGTPGLWELITMKEPNESIYDGNDLNDYGEILHATNAMSLPNNPNKPKSNRSEKYKTLLNRYGKRRKVSPQQVKES